MNCYKCGKPMDKPHALVIEDGNDTHYLCRDCMDKSRREFLQKLEDGNPEMWGILRALIGAINETNKRNSRLN